MSALLGLLGASLMLPGASIALPPGLVAAYDLSRGNLLNWSEGPLTNLTRGGTPTPTEAPGSDGYAAWFVFAQGAPSSGQYVYSSGINMRPNTTYTVSAVVRMDSGAAPVLGTSGDLNADMSMVLAGDAVFIGTSVEALGGGLFRVSARASTNASIGVPNCGVVRYPGQSGRGFRVTALALRLAAAGQYERTTDGQTLLDRSVRLGVVPVRTNHLTYSEDLTQSVWTKARATATATRVTTDATANGFDYVWQALPSAVQGQAVSAFVDLVQGNTTVTDVRVLTNNGNTAIRSARVRWSDRTLVPHPDNTTAGTVAIEERGGGVLRVTVTVTLPALVASTGLFVYPSGWNNNNGVGQYVDVLRSQWGAPGAPYQRQTHGLLIDDSLRGVNMALTPDGFGSGFTTPALPTGWRYASDAPVSASVAAIRPNASIPGTYEVDITATNSDTVTRAFRLYVSPAASASDAVMVTAGDVVTLSAGLASNVTGNVSLNVYNYNAGRNFLANSSFSVNLAAGAPLARVGAARALTSDSTVVFALGVIEFALGAGASRSLTVHAPCFARGDIGLGYLRPPTHATLGSSAAAADSNDPTWGPTGMQFLGDDYANVSLPNADQMSWYVVAQQDVLPSNSGGNQAAFISKDVSGHITNPPFAVQFGPDLVPYNIACIVPSNPPTGDGNISSAGPGTFKLTLGVPAGIGGTYDGAILKTFVGGRLRGTATRAGALANTAGPLRIGQQKLGSSRYMTGTVYLVLVWARALTDREMGQVDRAVREYLGRKGVQYDRI